MQAENKNRLRCTYNSSLCYFEQVDGRAGHCHNNDRRLSHVQENEEISTLLYALGHYFSDEGITN